MALTLEGDVIMFRGEAIGRIRSDIGATLRADAVELIEEAHCSDSVDKRFEILTKRLKKEAKGGMIAVSEIQPILDDVKAQDI